MKDKPQADPRGNGVSPPGVNRRPARLRGVHARDAFLARFEREVDPNGELPEHERRTRAEHAKRAYMLQLAKRSARARSITKNVPPPREGDQD